MKHEHLLSLSSLITPLLPHNPLILTTPQPAARWRRNFKEVTPSSTIEGQFDHPLDAAMWLQHFKTQNAELFKTLQVRTAVLKSHTFTITVQRMVDEWNSFID